MWLSHTLIRRSISAMIWKSSCDAEVVRLQKCRYRGRKAISGWRQLRIYFTFLPFPFYCSIQGAVEVTGWLCICGACFRSLNNWFVLPVCYGDLRCLTFLGSGNVMMPVPAGFAQWEAVLISCLFQDGFRQRSGLQIRGWEFVFHNNSERTSVNEEQLCF